MVRNRHIRHNVPLRTTGNARARVLTGERVLLTRWRWRWRWRRRRCRRLDDGIHHLLRRPLYSPVNGRWSGFGGGVRLLRTSDYPIDGRRSGEFDDNRLESDHVAAGRVPRRRHYVRVVRLGTGEQPGTIRLERYAPRRSPAQPVVRLARVRAEHADRHQPDVQRMVGALFEHVRVHW